MQANMGRKVGLMSGFEDYGEWTEETTFQLLWD